QALDFLCRTYRTEHPQNMEGEIMQGRSRGATNQIELTAYVSDKWYRYLTYFKNSSVDQAWPEAGRSMKTDHAAEWTPWIDAAKFPLPITVLLRLESSKLIQPQPATNPTSMSSEGI